MLGDRVPISIDLLRNPKVNLRAFALVNLQGNSFPTYKFFPAIASRRLTQLIPFHTLDQKREEMTHEQRLEISMQVSLSGPWVSFQGMALLRPTQVLGMCP